MQKELGEVLTLHLELPQRMEILEACWGGGCHGDRGAGPRNPREAALPSHLVIRALHWTSGPAQGSLLVCHLRASAHPKPQIWGALTSRVLSAWWTPWKPPSSLWPHCGPWRGCTKADGKQVGSRPRGRKLPCSCLISLSSLPSPFPHLDFCPPNCLPPPPAPFASSYLSCCPPFQWHSPAIPPSSPPSG